MPLSNDILTIYVETTQDYFEELFGLKLKSFKLAFFNSNATTYVKWSEVMKREIILNGFIRYELPPLLRVNRLLSEEWLPVEVVISTLMEEMVHLYLGFDKKNPHDLEFYSMALQCPEFSKGLIWKERNARAVAEFVKNRQSNAYLYPELALVS